MSQYCYASKKAPPGAVDPNGLPCDCSCGKPTIEHLHGGYMVDGRAESLPHMKGKMFKTSIPKRIVPAGENRKTAHWGGDGETKSSTGSKPYSVSMPSVNKEALDLYLQAQF